MDILEQLARVIRLIEADDIDVPDDDADKEDDKQAAARAEKQRAIARGDMERPDPERQDKPGSRLAPASKYASGLKNTPDRVTRSGEGDRPVASATAFRHVNELMKTVAEFIEKHGDIASIKHSAPQKSYLDKHKDDLAKQARKDAGQKVGDDNMTKFSKGSKDKVISLMNDALDPNIGPDRRKIAQNVFWQFLQGITVGRKQAWKQKVQEALDKRIEQMTVLVTNKFKEQGKTVPPETIQKRVAQKVKETFTMDLDDKTKAKNKQYDEELFMVKESMMTISKQLQKLASEEANYEYKPGAFGEPPKIVEKGTELTHAEKKAAAKERAAAEKGEAPKASRSVGVRKPGQEVGSTTAKPKVAQPTMSSTADDDDEFEAIYASLGKKESIDRFLYNIMEVAAADYTPKWYDDL